MSAKSNRAPNRQPIRILTCCGVGMGTSLILRMNVEDILYDLGIPCEVNAGIASEGKSADVDLIMCSPEIEPVLRGAKPPIITVESFIDKPALRRKLEDYLVKTGRLVKEV